MSRARPFACAVTALSLAASLAGAETVEKPGLERREVRIGAFAFDPRIDGEPDLPAGERADQAGAGFRLVQLGERVRDRHLVALERAGTRPLQYYPQDTYLVWAPGGGDRLLDTVPGARWVGALHPAYKIAAELAGREGLIRNVDVMFYDAGEVPGTLAALAALGARVLGHHPAQPDRAFWNAVVELPADSLAAVAGLREVLWLGYQGPRPVLDDEMSAQIVAGNFSGGVPFTGYETWLDGLALDGTGVTWAIVDTGVDYDHPDLGSHIVGGYSFPGACNANPGDDCTGGGHGTHVAGIVGGDAAAGFTDASGFFYGLGEAPGYGIFAMNSISGSGWPPAGGWQEHSKRAVLGGAIGGNNSWTSGEGTAHGYQASERTHDIMVLDGNFDTATIAEPFIEVFSAGNSGPGASTLTAPKEAKNTIVVANSLNFRAGSIDVLRTSSSRGPTVDGRYGITVAAPGTQIASARNDLGGSCSTAIAGTNNLYAFCTGTSMAAPHVSGAIVLVTEWWRSQRAGADPSPAMARALIVNSAVDMGTADIPNTHEGWGRVHLGNLFQSPVARIYEDEVVVFGAPGESVEYAFAVDDPAEPLRVTLAWSDAPGAVGANPALVNDLDLTVTTAGATYLGNVFSAGWSATGGTADALHNLENVYVESPGATVSVRVDAVNVAGDAILYNADPTDQSFALVCTNCRLDAMPFLDGFESGDTGEWSFSVP